MDKIKEYALLAWAAIKSRPTLFIGGVAAGFFLAKIF